MTTAGIEIKAVIDKVALNGDICLSLMNRLESVYKKMDEKYNEAAEHYGFSCGGCEDNCCFTRFYHHTFAELFYMRKGMETLELVNRAAIKERALSVCRQTDELDKSAFPVRLLCPLNQDGMCILYEYRPMICRLHGLPHELTMPGGAVKKGEGCGEFNALCGCKEYLRFDRTPFYSEMAGLEKKFRETLGLSGRIKMTVAGIISSF